MEPSDETLLQDFNQRQVEVNAPVIAYVAIVIFLGIIGNAVAVAFYGLHVKSNVTTFLLMMLSLNDFITTVFSVSAFANLTHTVTFRSLTGCTIMYFFRFVFGANSNSLLLLIAVDRYLKIRWTFSKVQMSKRSAFIAVVCFLTYNTLMATRTFFLLDKLEIEIRLEDYNRTITGYHCTNSYNPAYQNVNMIMNMVDMVYVLLIFASLAFLYSAIGKWIASSNTRRRKHTMKMRTTDVSSSKSSADANKTVCSNTSNEEPIREANGNDHSKNIKTPYQQGAKISETHAADKQNSGNGTPSGKADSLLHKPNVESSSSVQLEQKLTLMVFVITVASMLSFVPFFIINTTIGEPNPSDPGEDELSALIQIGLRSYMLNTTLNPYIIGLFNREFRQFVVELLRKILCCR